MILIKSIYLIEIQHNML